MDTITDIKNYILYLKTQCGLAVTLHPLEKEHLIVPSELIAFNIHENSYCIYVKTHPAAQKHCAERQRKILEKCKEGSFCGTCYAGVREYIYPIRGQERLIGFISVGGYQCEAPNSYIRRTEERFSVPAEQLDALYPSLKKEIPDKRRIDTLLNPLCLMLELAYFKTETREGSENLTDRVVRYIRQYHTQNITVEDICRHFGCSRSRISHLFKSHVGKSFREFLTDLRIEDAKELLKYAELNITEIAYSVGFGDSNYFSSVFKSRVGMSPLAYQKATNRSRS
ncbi:MAG: helix-turn-helix domain-containing protein [Clostridia bacterium]|nr:helix-turn-helix domain-containing protein [Clostridia bacterium]